jgi:chromate reductase
MTIRVLAISGSLRRGSHNTKLLRSAATLLPGGSQLTLWDALKAVPPFDEDDEAGPPYVAVAGLRRAVRRADAVLIATPEYNHSIPGQLKNALDWLSRPLAGNPMQRKPVAVIGASTGVFGAVWAQAETRRILEALGAHVLDRELPIPTPPSSSTPTGSWWMASSSASCAICFASSSSALVWNPHRRPERGAFCDRRYPPVG